MLDQEKSKLSLAQVYEQEYLKITEAQKKIAVPGLLDKDDGEAEPLEVKRIKVSLMGWNFGIFFDRGALTTVQLCT